MSRCDQGRMSRLTTCLQMGVRAHLECTKHRLVQEIEAQELRSVAYIYLAVVI